MKKLLLTLSCFCAVLVTAAPLDLQMPFKAGTKTPVAGWETKGKLIDLDGVKAVALQPAETLKFTKAFNGKAGDKVTFTIVCKKGEGFLSLRLGQWSPEGWIGDNFVLVDAKKDFAEVKGEVVLKDAATADKAGIMRKVSRFEVRLYAHTNSKDVVIKDIKLDFIPKK